MGIFIIKIYFKYFNEINNDIKLSTKVIKNNKASKRVKNIIKDIKYHKYAPNPLFKNQKIITNKHKTSLGIDFNEMPCYEVYKLKNINSSIYFAFQNLEKNIDILKYDFVKFLKIKTINITPRLIRYFYDKVENKEYLIIQTIVEIHIFLIINEKEYKKIYSFEEKGTISHGAEGCSIGRLPINEFIIFCNKYENINYLIISFFYRADCTSHERKISIFKFDNNNNLIKVKEIISDGSTHKKLFLLWEDKKSEIYYLINNVYNDLKLFEINDEKTENILAFNKILRLFEDYLGCIINNKDGKDYLYIFEYSGTLIISDLYNKQIIKTLNIINNIESIANWNNNYIIFATKKHLYIFDTITEKIINKTFFNRENDIISINNYMFKDLNFYSLCLNSSDSKLIILY